MVSARAKNQEFDLASAWDAWVREVRKVLH